MTKSKKSLLPPLPLVVATVHTARGLRLAADLPSGSADVLELRLDCLPRGRARLAEIVQHLPLPVLLTARHPREGGVGELDAPRRAALLLEMLPAATFVDVELRSVRPLAEVLAAARRRKVQRVISFHDFRGTPPVATLRRRIQAAVQAGADIVKIATQLRGPQDLARLLQLQGTRPPRPLALMGMGPLGRVSRLALAAGGSRLNYGYLDRPQVPGQWPASQLRALLGEILP